MVYVLTLSSFSLFIIPAVIFQVFRNVSRSTSAAILPALDSLAILSCAHPIFFFEHESFLCSPATFKCASEPQDCFFLFFSDDPLGAP